MLPAQKPTWKCHQAGGASSLCDSRGLLPGPSGGKPSLCPSALSQLSVGSRCQMVPIPSTAFLLLPTSRMELSCATGKMGQGEGMICLLGKFLSSPMLLQGCSCPCKLYVSKKQVPFIFLPFLSSAGFHSHENARAPFTCLYATWLLTPHQHSSYFTPSTAILFDFFLYVLIFNCIRANDHLTGLFRILPFNPLIPIPLLQSKASHFL